MKKIMTYLLICFLSIAVLSIRVNAKSIMGMMSLGLDNGEELEIMADGKDEKAAADALEQFLSSKEA